MPCPLFRPPSWAPLPPFWTRMLSGTPNCSAWERIRLWVRKNDRSCATSVASALRRLPQQGGSPARRFHGTAPGRSSRTRRAERFGQKHFVARDSSPAPSERGHDARQSVLQRPGLVRKDRNRDEIVTRPLNEHRSAESVVLPQPCSAYRLAIRLRLARLLERPAPLSRCPNRYTAL